MPTRPRTRRRIRSAIGHLLGWDVLERLGKRVRRLPADEPLYIYRVPHGLRIIFSRERSREGDTITVLDILRQKTLEAFAASAAAQAPNDEPGSAAPRKPATQTKPKRAAPRTEASKGSHRVTRKVGHFE
jgi:hypothetical protein